MQIAGPLFLGMDTHALSEPCFATALEVLAANGVNVMIQKGSGYTPTPVVSHAILTYNRRKKTHASDGIVITPSHNPPEDGGFKYNPPHGGPADTDVTKWIEDRANALLQSRLAEVKRIPFERALRADTTHEHDYIATYVEDLANVINVEAIKSSGISMGVDPLGGASAAFWEPIAGRFDLKIDVVNPAIDPTFGFMTVDKDGKIRMDCSFALCHGEPHRIERQVRRGLRKRSRFRSPRYRGPQFRAYEPQPLPGRSRLVPFPKPSGMEKRCSRREDPREQQHDRQSGGISRQEAL